jgi:uncharacterized membrane protein YbhN (UPF0104 family)
MSSHARDIRSVAITLVTVLIFVLAVFALRHILREVTVDDVLDSLDSVTRRALVESVLLACGSYFMLTFYEMLAVRGVGRRLPFRRTALTSFIAFSISHSSGLSSISGGSIRYRSYAPLGLTALEIAGIMTLLTLTFWLGVSTMLGLSFVLSSGFAVPVLHLSIWEIRALGVLLLCLVVAYATISQIKHDKPVRIGKRLITMPPLRVTVAQWLSASTDLCLLSGALYVLLADYVPISYINFVGIFVLAVQLGILSNVPGGLGVFESVLLGLLPGSPSDDVLGAILLYRVIYYIAPFFLALALLAGREMLERVSRWRESRSSR